MGSERVAATAVFEAGSKPDFFERVAALSGRSTWREPSGAGQSNTRQIPAEHLVAAALAYGRRSRDDVGPDIACDIAMQRAGHPNKILPWLGRALTGVRIEAFKKNRHHIGPVALITYNCMVLGHMAPPAPENVDPKHWQEMLDWGCCLLSAAAMDALALAERRLRAREVA